MRSFACIVALLILASITAAQEPETIELKTVEIDKSTVAKERLHSVRADTHGRLFVGAYDMLFVYDPNDKGGYGKRKLLYRFPELSWITDIETRGDDLYVLTSSAFYVFTDGARKRADLRPRKLVWGCPGALFAGMRKLAWGPEGDLYFTIGDVVPQDRWAYWTFFDAKGTKTPYRGIGGVFRCKPDGTDLRIVAQGLRHAGEFSFDRHWNLFTSDYEAKRNFQLWHVPPHAQLGKGFGDADRLPPMFSEDGEPFRAGPMYYDDPHLPAKLHRQLLVLERGRLKCFAVEPRGASFKAASGPQTSRFDGVAVTIGRGGRLFSVSDDTLLITKTDDVAGHPFEPYEAADATPEKLWKELTDISWHRRYRAHVEITRRGGDLLKQANKKLLDVNADDPALHHLIWLAAKSGQGSLHLISLLAHNDPKVRVQTIRALTEFPDQLRDEPVFLKLMRDKDSHVRQAAVSAYFEPKLGFSREVQAEIERGPACDSDPYIRQPAVRLLAAKATFKQIEALCASIDAKKRLAGVLAAGYRLVLPPATTPAQHLPLNRGMGQGVWDIEYADGKVDLSQRGPVGTFTLAEHWKADKQTQEQNFLFKLLRKMSEDEEEPVRVQARQFLDVLADPRIEK